MQRSGRDLDADKQMQTARLDYVVLKERTRS